ncbi:mitochondrial arginine transporter BAC2-like [Phragmites australis]|uniref:mitochondrial arginine transporter BAC2-like n=1 Tax=Phragmites australis TaxID=29695 RepID=UPI002D79C8FD|nr:mitochondrial arginine transporter BAC2-like [Phragmites australis]
MEFWPEFLASSCGKEFVAGGVGGMAGVLAGHPLDTLRIRLQQPPPPPASPGIVAARRAPSTAQLLRGILRTEGASALYRGMGAPLASVAFQNAMVFQVYAILSRSLDPESSISEPPSYTSVAFAGVGTGALQTLVLSPVELVKIKLQLEAAGHKHRRPGDHHGPVDMARDILRKEGLRGIYRGLTVTALRDAPAHGVYFWTYEYARERLHPGCRRDGDESLATMLVSGGLAGVASWVCCYPLDVVKSRLQAQTFPPRYRGVVDCFRRSIREEGLPVLWRGLGTAVARAFVVNGAIFSAYELALRFLASGNGQRLVMEEN